MFEFEVDPPFTPQERRRLIRISLLLLGLLLLILAWIEAEGQMAQEAARHHRSQPTRQVAK